MSDNTEITHGSGTSIATDEIAGVHHQRVKLQIGADGTAVDVSSAEPLPISDSGGSLTVDSEALGTKAEAEASGEGGVIGILKRLRTLWGAGLPGTLTASGNLKTAIVEALPAGTQEIGKVKVTESPAVVLAAGTAEVGKVKVTELPSLVLAAGSAAIGKVIVSKLEEALPAGTNNIGKVTVAVIEAGANAIGKLAANAGVNIGSVGLVASSHEGVEAKLVISAASTNSTLVKNAAGKVFGWHIFNKEAVPIYVKLYNKASAPTVGTDTQVMVIPIPAGAAANVEFTNGIAFSTGIGLGITKGAANANTEAVASEGVIVNLLWK